MFDLQEKIVSLIESDQLEDAVESLDLYQKQYSKDDFYFLAYSDVLFAMGLFYDVIDTMQDCIQAGYEASIVYERIADAYIALKDYSSALNWLEKCDLQTDSEEGLHNLFSLGVCYMHLEQYKKAVSYFEDVLLDSDSSQAKIKAAMCYWLLNRKKRAIEYFDELVDEPELLLQICMFLGKQDDLEQLDHYLSKVTDPMFVSIQKVEFYICNKMFEPAIELLLELVKEDPNVYLYCVLADTYAELTQQSEAVYYYRKALNTENTYEKEPGKIVSLYLYALERSQYAVSTKHKYIKKYLKTYPEDVDVYFACVAYYFNNQDYLALNYLLCQQSHPIFYHQEDEYRFLYYQVESCFYADHYKQAYKLLLPHLEYRKDKLFEKQYAIACFYTQRYDKCIQYASRWLPDGMLASLIIYIYQETGHMKDVEKIRDIMEQSVEAGEHVDDLDVYLRHLEEAK